MSYDDVPQDDPAIFIYPEVCAHDTVTGWNVFLRVRYEEKEYDYAICAPSVEKAREGMARLLATGRARVVGMPPEKRPPHVRVFSPDGGWLGACCAKGTGR